jgi:RecA/RadA recombinase
METHTVLGIAGSDRGLTLSPEERRRHIGVFGATGVGKSTLLRHVLAQDMARGDGVLLLDPHGDLAEAVLADVPARRSNHVCYVNVADLEHPVGLNVLEDVHADDRAVAVDNVVAALRAIWHDSWGPRMELILRHAATALIETNGASLVLLPRLLTDAAYRARVVARLANPLTRAFFVERFDRWRDGYREEAIEPVLNKVEALLLSPALRNILGQATSTLHFEHALAHGRIVIANLAKGLIGESHAHLLGALLLARVQAAAMARARVAAEARRDFHVVIDEAHNFGTQTIAALLSEGRKYGLSLTIATQYLAALDDGTRAALLGNVSTLVSFRVGSEDALVLAPKFNRTHQAFNPQALQELARGDAIVRFPDEDSAQLRVPEPRLVLPSADTLKRQSRRHYSRSRRIVEAKIIRALG